MNAVKNKTEERHLHIISFDVPWPPNYGGVIDVFYKIKSLAEAGIKVHLHCFMYGRTESKKLNQFCYKVHYYNRNIFKNPFFSNKPYIVNSRQSRELLSNLKKAPYPILFEGVHSCFYLGSQALKNRCKIVRMHNIEHIYYMNLARIEKNPFKRYFFYTESNRLQQFQKTLKQANVIAAISPADHKSLSLKYNNCTYLPVFHSNTKLETPEGRGDFVLYHGNLSVGENNEAALYLIQKVFKDLKIPFIIAGMNPSNELRYQVSRFRHIKLYDNLGHEAIRELIRRAHINLLPTFQSTGIKLKLINVLFNGRFCIVNKKMVNETGLESLCYIADTPSKMKERVKNLFEKEFSVANMEKRKTGLATFNNSRNAQLLIDALYD